MTARVREKDPSDFGIRRSGGLPGIFRNGMATETIGPEAPVLPDVQYAQVGEGRNRL